MGTPKANASNGLGATSNYRRDVAASRSFAAAARNFSKFAKSSRIVHVRLVTTSYDRNCWGNALRPGRRECIGSVSIAFIESVYNRVKTAVIAGNISTHKSLSPGTKY